MKIIGSRQEHFQGFKECIVVCREDGGRSLIIDIEEAKRLKLVLEDLIDHGQDVASRRCGPAGPRR